jgi:excisionase family DNA binding protein
MFVRSATLANTTPAPAPETGSVYTLSEAARLKGVSYHTVSRAIRSGKLPARRVGRMAFVVAADLAAWQPMVQRAPRKYRRRAADPTATPALLDLASGDRVVLAQRFALLAEGLHAAAMDHPIDAFLALLCERLADALGLSRVSVWGRDEAAGVARRLAAFGPPLSTLPDAIPLPEATDFARLLDLRAAAVLDSADLTQVPRAAGQPGEMLGVGRFLAAALRVGDHKLGTLQGDRGGRAFALDADQLALAQAVANQAAIAIEIARLRTALAEPADGAA